MRLPKIVPDPKRAVSEAIPALLVSILITRGVSLMQRGNLGRLDFKQISRAYDGKKQCGVVILAKKSAAQAFVFAEEIQKFMNGFMIIRFIHMLLMHKYW